LLEVLLMMKRARPERLPADTHNHAQKRISNASNAEYARHSAKEQLSQHVSQHDSPDRHSATQIFRLWNSSIAALPLTSPNTTTLIVELGRNVIQPKSTGPK
jgi:hypothetical protein